MCDSNSVITNIFTKYPGSVHEKFLWESISRNGEYRDGFEVSHYKIYHQFLLRYRPQNTQQSANANYLLVGTVNICIE